MTAVRRSHATKRQEFLVEVSSYRSSIDLPFRFQSNVTRANRGEKRKKKISRSNHSFHPFLASAHLPIYRYKSSVIEIFYIFYTPRIILSSTINISVSGLNFNQISSLMILPNFDENQLIFDRIYIHVFLIIHESINPI